jgi:primary-amine oxidase
MTATTSSATTKIRHPLARLTAQEIEANRAILVDAGQVTENTIFALVSLVEPDKQAVLAGDPGIDRQVRTLLVDAGRGKTTEHVSSLASGTVISSRVIDIMREGQAPVTETEYKAAQQMVRRDPAWREAIRRRGITDIDSVQLCPLSAGCFDGRRHLTTLPISSLSQKVHVNGAQRAAPPGKPYCRGHARALPCAFRLRSIILLLS